MEKPDSQTDSTPINVRRATPAGVSALRQQGKKSRPKWQWIVAAILAVALAYALAWAIGKASAGGGPRGDRYQAVFLDNDQVFFGKLKNTDGSYLRLEQAFSTKSNDLPSDASAEQRATASNNISLVKVGDLVYGPENVLMIRAEKVKFWQDLKTDSKVSQAIEKASK
ncbi:MAG TPA: hypothetical protein VF597_00935 [Candidatus Saccharimonadales bacterium]|jgi:hypothetical protein